MPRKIVHPTRGFTLIEVMVALTIVAVSLGAGLKAYSVLIDNTQRQRDVFIAGLCAENELAKLRLAKAYPSTSVEDFSCEQLGRTLKGVLDIANTPNPSFRRVDAVVSDGEYTVLRLTTVIGRF